MVWRPSIASRLELAARPQAEAVELPRGHVPALDAIRGLAVLVVTLYRFGGGSDGAASAIEPGWIVHLGSRGVDLFFVLSGFLITGILYDAKEKPHYFRNFYMRRSLRIFPLYYAALVVGLLALPAVSSSAASTFQPAAENQAWLWLYGANVLQALRGAWCLGPLNHFWSLAIEEHFYLVWPAVIYFTTRRGAMWACGALFAGSIAARAAWLALGGNDVAAEVLTPLRMDGLVLGAWLALAARGEGGFARLAAAARPALVVFGLAAIVVEASGRRWFGLPYAVFALACGALLIAVLAAGRESWLAAMGRSRFLRLLGKYSYGMYVFQLPLIYVLAPAFTAAGAAAACGSAYAGQALYCLVMSGITLAAAMASWHLFEKHVLALKQRFE